MARDIEDAGFEVEEGREVVRRTIVGGRPLARQKRRIRIPIGIEKVLCRAAGDARFREALFQDRRRAIDDAGYHMAETEIDVLAGVPDTLLLAMISRIDLKRHSVRRFMKGVVTAAFGMAAATSTLSCDKDEGGGIKGIEPDIPDSVEVKPADVQPEGVMPEAEGVFDDDQAVADMGIEPDIPEDVVLDEGLPIKGILPDEPDVLDLPEMRPAGILPDEAEVESEPIYPDAGVQTELPPDEAQVPADVVDVEVGPAGTGVMPDMPKPD